MVARSKAIESAPAGSASDAEPLAALMDRYIDGDARAFEELYRKVAPRLFGYLVRLTRDRPRAEDLLQATFAKVHRARSSYLRGASPLPWLLAIARHCFYDERRSARRRPEDLSFSGVVPEPPPESPSTATDVSDALEQALSSLPESYREAIELTKVSSLSVAEAAEVVGASETAVKLRVHRGYKLLRESLKGFSRS